MIHQGTERVVFTDIISNHNKSGDASGQRILSKTKTQKDEQHNHNPIDERIVRIANARTQS